MPTVSPAATIGAASCAASGGVDHRLGLVVRARRGRQHQRAVGDRLLERVVKHRARRGRGRRPTPSSCACSFGQRLPRLDQPQPRRGRNSPWRAPPRRCSRRAAARPGSPPAPAARPSRLVLSVPAPGMQCSSAGKCPEAAALPKPAACVKRRHRIRPKCANCVQARRRLSAPANKAFTSGVRML